MSARDELTTLILGKTAPRAADAILAAGYRKPGNTNDLLELSASLAAHRPLWNEVADENLHCLCGNFWVPNTDDAGRRWADHAAGEFFESQAATR